ncbi:protein eyes shut homolog [Scleropages formosus]|uniref:protein eyes shut homolog n=1 Tax=Scleropages formosus TaxID=113540 RepID=UPI0008788113|nr:protein eyes shut homolog [Scleropages formosus]
MHLCTREVSPLTPGVFAEHLELLLSCAIFILHWCYCSIHILHESSPFYNYTGCIEIIEINKMNRFHVSRAIGGSNVNNCSPLHSSPFIVGQPTVTPPALTTSWASLTMAPTPAPTRPALACDHTPCRNGGTCQPLWLASGAASFLCDCPLHFSGHLCEQDTTVFFPSFNGNSYLELPSLTSILQSGGDAQSPSSQDGEDTVTLYLTLKTGSSHGTILYRREVDYIPSMKEYQHRIELTGS